MASFSYVDSPCQHVPSTPSCFHKYDWTSPEAEVPQIQQSQNENEGGPSDYGVPKTPQFDLATSLSRSYLNSAQDKNEMMKSPDLAPELKYCLFNDSPQNAMVSSMSPFNCLMEQVVPGMKEDASRKFRLHCYRLCKPTKRQILLNSRLKKTQNTGQANTSKVERQQSKYVSTETQKFKLFEDDEIFA